MKVKCWSWMKLLAGKWFFALSSPFDFFFLFFIKALDTDENPNSIDAETDIKIQSLIKTAFSNHTVISVAHKLETIVDFDFVGVLGQGRLVEFDDPKVLLQKQGSRFGVLWAER